MTIWSGGERSDAFLSITAPTVMGYTEDPKRNTQEHRQLSLLAHGYGMRLGVHASWGSEAETSA